MDATCTIENVASWLKDKQGGRVPVYAAPLAGILCSAQPEMGTETEAHGRESEVRPWVVILFDDYSIAVKTRITLDAGHGNAVLGVVGVNANPAGRTWAASCEERE